MAKNKLLWLVLSCIAALAMLAVSCGGGGEKTTPAATDAQGLKGEVIFAVDTLTDEHLPAHWVQTGGNFPLAYILYDYLTASPEITPRLAENWTYSSDGLTWTFKLRKDAKFHNGDPITAEDVIYTIKLNAGATSRSSMGKTLAGFVTNMEAVDANTVKLTLKQPFPDLVYRTRGIWGIMPKKYMESVGEEAFSKNPVGSGPFKFVSKTPGDSVEFEGYEGYWGEGPYIKKLTFKIIPEASTRLAALKTGTADIASNMIGPVAKQVKEDSKLRTISVKGTGILQLFYWDLYDTKSPLSNVKVREALQYAVNRQGYCDTLFAGEASPLFTPICTSDMYWYDPSWKPYPYDPEKARKLLAEAGYPDGFEIPMYAGAGGSCAFGPQTSEAAAADLLKVGVKVKYQEVESGIYWGKAREGAFNGLVLNMLTFDQGPQRNFDVLMYKRTYPFHNDPAFDKAVDACAGIMDPVQRKAAAQKLINQMWNEYHVSIPLVAGNSVFGVGPKIADWKPWPTFGIPSGFETIKVK